LNEAELPARLRRLVKTLAGSLPPDEMAAPLVVAYASELILGNGTALPRWHSRPDTRFLIIIDVPEPAIIRLPELLGLRRADDRIHATRDPGAIRRLIISLSRRDPFLGIVDAYIVGNTLDVVTGDFVLRSFPLDRVPGLDALGDVAAREFEIDEDGSYLHWPAGDLHMGVSQLLQAVDPMYLAEIEIERYSNDHTGAALRSIREEKRVRQSDIRGLSERQVRRIEDGISRLRADTARKFAEAFAMPLGDLLNEVARRAGQLRSAQETAPAEAKRTKNAAPGTSGGPEAAVLGGRNA
jgi:hypothetical protein